MSNSPEFGRRLKALRQEQGLTQDVLAERVGCATETIRKLESGRRRPSFQMAARIAEVLRLEQEAYTSWMRAARQTSERVELPLGTEATPTVVRARALPTYLTPFVGREREQAMLSALLGQPGYRLITLLGPGGVGKTRLAVEVAQQVKGFPDGVIFVPLAPVAAPQAIVPAIGAASGFNFSGPTELLTQLLRFLHDKHALLILDNLEHLLSDPETTLPLLEQLVVHAPHITLLVTSRERLKLPGEWVRELAGLAVPPADDVPYPADYPACALFAEHAQRIMDGFHLVPENRRTVASICRLVGGMPLGIELAASWMRVLSLEEIGQELVGNLDAQHLSPGTLPARHRSLRSVVDHSWNLLSETERQVLAKLSVFHGGFSREAAHRVAQANLPVLASLVDKSLLRRKADGRYDLHEIIRQYAAARLKEDSEAHRGILDRHAAYYSAWLGERQARLQSKEQAAIMSEISTEVDNLRAAWLWAAEHGQLAALRQAADTLHWFYEFRSWFEEGTAMFLRVVEVLQQAAPADADDEHRHTLGEILAHLSHLATRNGAMDLAGNSLARSLDLLHDSPDAVPLAYALMYQGMYSFFVGDYDQAGRALKKCRAIVPAGDQFINAFCDTWETMVALAQGEYEEAERFFRAGLARYRAMENNRGLLISTTFCSTPLITQGKYQEVEALLQEGLRVAELLDDRYGTAIALHQLGLVASAQNRTTTAIDRFHESLALCRALGSYWDIARVSNQLGAALMASGEPAEAGQALLEALKAALEGQIIPEALHALGGLATLLSLEGHCQKALEIAAHILAEPAANSKTREQARQLRAALRAQLPAEQVALIEGRGRNRPLTEIAAEMITQINEGRK